jgi:hypothetical protein
MKITTNCIFRSGTLDGGTIFDGWTNVKQRKASEVPSGNSQTNNVRGKGQDLAKTLITKTASIMCLLSCKMRKLRVWEHQRNCSHLSLGKIIAHNKELQMSANAFKFLALARVTEFHITTTITTTTTTTTITTTTTNNNNYYYYYLEVS